MVNSPGQRLLFTTALFRWESEMIGRLFIVLGLGGALLIAASWNTGGIGYPAIANHHTSQPQVIMTVAIDPDPAPPIPAPSPPVVRSSWERLIAQN